MVWTDSQDYGADEILNTTRIVLFDKINRLMCEIIILFEVYPQMFLENPAGTRRTGDSEEREKCCGIWYNFRHQGM